MNGGGPQKKGLPPPTPKEMGRPQRNGGDPMDVGWSSMSAGGPQNLETPPQRDHGGGGPKTHSGCGAELNEWQRLT